MREQQPGAGAISVDRLRLSAPGRLEPGHVDVVIASAFSAVLVLWSVFFLDGGSHWFVVPVVATAWIFALDVSRWMRGRLDMFDPLAVIGLIGIYFFGIAPLLHVDVGHWPRAVQTPGDWRDWMGIMASINLVSVALYRFVAIRVTKATPFGVRRVWEINRGRFWQVLPLVLFLTAALQVYVYSLYGGFMGYIRAYEMRYQLDGFEGMGMLFSISESFPILAYIGYAVLASRKPWLRQWGVIVAALAVFFVLNLLFGGLRGSRSNTIWALFWAAGITHFGIRAIPRLAVVAAMPVLFGFMYVYGFYKSIGSEAFEMLWQGGTIEQLEERTTRTREVVLLGDLSRADVQALILFRTTDPASDYELAWGRSYAGGLAKLVPRQLWPGRPVHKIREGTNVQYGNRAYERGLISSRVYGLGGEAMLNFGPFGVPLVMIAFGGIIGYTRCRYKRWPRMDSRWLIFPFIVNLCFVILVSDSDNVVFFFFKNGLLPISVIILCSRWSVVGDE
jgi:hypothetical protein